MDDLLTALGLRGIEKSGVSRICHHVDSVGEQFRQRPLQDASPYLWVDGLDGKVRQNQRIANQAVVMAIGVRETGEREGAGFAVGASEEQAFWVEFLRSLLGRGLDGVQVVISDAQEGLKAAIGQVLSGGVWQRCRVQCLRNLLAPGPQGDKAMVAAAARTIFAPPRRQAAGQHLQEGVQALQLRWQGATKVLVEAEEDGLAYMAFPREHWTRIFSTNGVERLNREVQRRTEGVGGFPDVPSIIRLSGAVLLEIDDEGPIERRSFSLESMQKLKEPLAEQVATASPLRLAPVRSPENRACGEATKCTPLDKTLSNRSGYSWSERE